MYALKNISEGDHYQHLRNKNEYVVVKKVGLKIFDKWLYFIIYEDINKSMWFIRTVSNFIDKFTWIYSPSNNNQE